MSVDWGNQTQVDEFRAYAIGKGGDSAEIEGFINKNVIGRELPMSIAPDKIEQVKPMVGLSNEIQPEVPSLETAPIEQINEIPQQQRVQQPNLPTPQPAQESVPKPTGNARITQKFGNPNAGLYGRNRKGQANINRGVDVAKEKGEPQFAPTSGKWVVEDVQTGKWNTGWGNSVVIKNKETGETIRKSHFDKVLVKPGQEVTGQAIGTTGRTGRTTGYHSDTEYTKDGKLMDYAMTPYFNETSGGSDQYVPNQKYLYK